MLAKIFFGACVAMGVVFEECHALPATAYLKSTDKGCQNTKKGMHPVENQEKTGKMEKFSSSAKKPMCKKMVVAPGGGAWTRRCLDKGEGRGLLSNVRPMIGHGRPWSAAGGGFDITKTHIHI